MAEVGLGSPPKATGLLRRAAAASVITAETRPAQHGGSRSRLVTDSAHKLKVVYQTVVVVLALTCCRAIMLTWGAPEWGQQTCVC